MRQSKSKLALLLFLFPGVALAHTGHGEAAGLMHGFSHPLGGLDHLLAMVAVGLWAAQAGGRALWAVPCAFVGAMILGGVLALLAVPVPFVETGILVSVLVLGILIAGAFKLSLVYSAAIVGFFAMFHGFAHGAEIPAAINAVSYTLGFVAATALLHLAGLSLGSVLQKINLPVNNRWAGGAIALGGIYLAVS